MYHTVTSPFLGSSKYRARLERFPFRIFFTPVSESSSIAACFPITSLEFHSPHFCHPRILPPHQYHIWLVVYNVQPQPVEPGA